MLKHFNQLMDILMSFNLGVRQYNDQQYITVENVIKDLVHYDIHIEMRNKSIVELLGLEPAHAFRLINRFKNIFLEIERDFFKVVNYDSRMALEQFEATCYHRGVLVKRSSWEGEVIVTSNFTNDLENDIWARKFTISQMNDALKSAIEDKVLDPMSIFVEASDLENLPNNNVSETQKIVWSEWDKITERGMLISRLNAIDKILYPKLNGLSGFLNKKGESVIKSIQDFYKGAKPADIFAVYYAMVKLELITEDKKNLFKLTRKAVAEALGGLFETPLSTQIVGHNINMYENRSSKYEERVKDAEHVIKGFLKKQNK